MQEAHILDNNQQLLLILALLVAGVSGIIFQAY